MKKPDIMWSTNYKRNYSLWKKDNHNPRQAEALDTQWEKFVQNNTAYKL